MGHHHPHLQDSSREAMRATWIGAFINLALAALKITVGTLGHSAALVADGVHSLSDLASDAVVLLATRHGRQPADAQHPYGHARFETAATVVLSFMLAAAAIGIGWDAVNHINESGQRLVPALATIVVAAVSLISNEWLYQYTMRVAKRVRSKLLEANAWHHRSDAISSFVVFIGIGGAMAGVPMLDGIAAFIVALMILHIAWDLLSNSVKELVDTAVDEDTEQQIRALINQTDGVVSLHMLRTRLTGANILIDAHLQVSPRLSVSEGHHIAESVRSLLIHELDHIQDVTIHIDPEDDESGVDNSHLPLRQELLERLQNDWGDLPHAGAIQDIMLHYLDGKIEVEIRLPLPEGGIEEAKKIQARFTKLAINHKLLSAIKVSFNEGNRLKQEC